MNIVLPYLYEFVGSAILTYNFGMSGGEITTPKAPSGGFVMLKLYLIALWLCWNNSPAQFNGAIALADVFIIKKKEKSTK